MRPTPATALAAVLLTLGLLGCGATEDPPAEQSAPSSEEPEPTTEAPTTEEPTTEEPSVPVVVDGACGPEVNALLLPLSEPGSELVDGYDLPEAMLDDLDVGCTLTSETQGLSESTETYAVVSAAGDADQVVDYVLQIYGVTPAQEPGFWEFEGEVVGFDLPLPELVERLGGPPPAFEDAQDWVVFGVSTEALRPPLG